MQDVCSNSKVSKFQRGKRDALPQYNIIQMTFHQDKFTDKFMKIKEENIKVGGMTLNDDLNTFAAASSSSSIS